MDKIFIKDLLVRCIIGVFPKERDHRQDVCINITLFADLYAAGQSDDLEDTVDYKELRNEIVTFVEQSEYQLIETLAARVAEICLRPEAVKRVIVHIDKPRALAYTRSVAVEIERTDGDAER